jgi:hypothetical protein
MKPQLSVANPSASTVSEQIGLSEEQKTAVIKKTQNIVKTAISEGRTKGEILAEVWNSFDEPTECAFSLFILSATETEVYVHEMFALPEAVETKQD